MMEFDVTVFATWIPLIAGVIVPFFVVTLAKVNASPNVKSFLAAVGAALTALGMYLGDAGVHNWKGAASAFVLTLIIAVASRFGLTQQYVDKLDAKVPGVIG